MTPEESNLKSAQALLLMALMAAVVVFTMGGCKLISEQTRAMKFRNDQAEKAAKEKP